MNRPIRKAGFFAKAEGAGLGWKERLAKLKGKSKPKSTAKLEIDDATGKTMIFPDLGDVSEIVEGVTVEAENGPHVFTADSSTYTIEVLDGKVTSVIEDQTGTDDEGNAMSPETQEFIEAVAAELEANEQFRATAQASIDKLTSDLATAMTTIATLKAGMSHKKPGEGEGTEPGEGGVGATGEITVGGKKINISKINLNSKK